MNQKVRTVLNEILRCFQSGDIPKAIALSMFPIPNIPAHTWSLLNRTLMFLVGTADARGIKQWNKVGRKVKKGTKAFSILGPYFKKEVCEETGEEKQVLKGFFAIPVFRVEDTEGNALEYEKIKLPEFPLMEKAYEWNISVKAVPGNYKYYGAYIPGTQEIVLASKEETVFFHELSHAAHKQIKGDLKTGQDPFQEMTAELSAAVLCQLVGKSAGKHLGTHYQYIASYAKKANLTAHQGCLRVMSDVEKVLHRILAKEETDAH